METIIIDRAELSNKLQVMSKVISVNNAIPIFDGFLFEVTNDTMRITASDTETTITSSVAVLETITEELEVYVNFVIDAKTIIGIVKTLNHDQITIVINDANSIVTIDYGTGRYEIPMLGAKDYLKPKQLNADKINFSVDPAILRRGISRTVFATLNDVNFPALSGVNIAIEDGVLSFAATDRYKIASVDNSLPNISACGSFILIAKAAIIIKDVLSKVGAVIDVTFDNTSVIFESREYTIHARTISAKFPNYRGVLSRNDGKSLIVDRLLLASAIERISLCVSKISSMIRVDVSNNVMSISAQDLLLKKSAKEELPCAYDDECISFGLVLNNLSEILKTIHSNDVVFKIKSPKHGFIITPDCDSDDETLIMMAMPLALS